MYSFLIPCKINGKIYCFKVFYIINFILFKIFKYLVITILSLINNIILNTYNY